MNSTIVGLVAAIAVLSGGLGLSLTEVFDVEKPISSSTATGFLMGQVIIEARNTDGELIAYRQTDNEVVDDGEQCILKMLFASSVQSTPGTFDGRGEYTSTNENNGGEEVNNPACSGVLTGAWDVIAIGLGTTAVAETDVVLESELNDAIESTSLTLDRGVATTKTWTNGTAVGGAETTKIVLKKTFTAGGAATVTESGLFNSTTVVGSGMLAHQTFNGVVLASGDSITVQWTFTVGD